MEIKEKKTSVLSRPAICLLLSALVCALWGSLYTCIKYGYTALEIDTKNIPSILLFAGVRFLICGAVLVSALVFKEKKQAVPQKHAWLPIIIIALLTVILHYSMTYIGLSLTSGAKTSVLKQIGYLFVSCLAFLFIKEDKFRLGKLFGGILGFGSIIVMNLDGGSVIFTIGDALIILASLCSAGGNIVSKRSYHLASPVSIVAWSQLLGGALLTIVSLALGGGFHQFDYRGFLILFYICSASIIAYCLWNMLLRTNPLSLMSIYKFMEPLFGVIVAAIFMPNDEDIFQWKYLFALLLLLAGIIISNLKLHKKKKTQDIST